MRYFIFQNANKVTAVSDEQLPAEALEDADASEHAALAIANGRFATSPGVNPGATFRLDVYDPESDAADELPLPAGAIVQLAKGLHENEDLSFDDDAEISGMNVQCWRYVEPEEALEYLSTAEPMDAERTSPDRGDAALAPYRALRKLADDLVAELQGRHIAVLDSDARIRGLIGLIKALPPTLESDPDVVLSRPLRSWEIGEGSDEDFTDVQRRDWRLEVEQKGVQFHLSIFPEGTSRDDVEEGLGLFIEINKGRPAVHVSPSPNADTAVHLHSIGNGVIEAVPCAGFPPPQVTSTVYGGPAQHFGPQ